MRLEHLNHLVELLIRPIRAQLADAPLDGGLADVWWLYGLRRQQRPWLTDVIKNACHQFIASIRGSGQLNPVT